MNKIIVLCLLNLLLTFNIEDNRLNEYNIKKEYIEKHDKYIKIPGTIEDKIAPGLCIISDPAKPPPQPNPDGPHVPSLEYYTFP